MGHAQIARREKELAPREIIVRRQLPGIPTAAFEQTQRLFGEEIMPAFA